MKKTVYITEDNLAVLESLKKRYSMTGSQVLNFLLLKENENWEEKIAKAVRMELEKNYLSKERMRWATQTAEQNSIVILDVLNTILHRDNLNTCITVDFAANPVITESKEHLKSKIHYFKEKSDERKSKEVSGGNFDS